MGNRAIGVWVRPGREISVLFVIFGVVSACGRPPEVEAPTDAAPPSGWDGVTPLFRDATVAWGLDGINAAGVRVSSLDLDDDGWPDLQVRALTSGEDPSAGVRNTWVLRNDGAGHFVDQTEASGVTVGRVGPRSAPVWAVGDVNGDDVLDLFTGRPNPGTGERSELLIGGSDGAFTLALPQGFSFDPQDNPFGASFADVDRDGHLDLWVAHGAVGGAPRASSLWRGDGEGGFTLATSEAGLQTASWASTEALNAALAHPNAWSAAACDLDDDGDPELLAASYGRAPNKLFRNDGGAFTDASLSSGYAYDERQDWRDNESARCWCQLHPDDEDCGGLTPPTIRCDEDADAFRWDHRWDREPYRLGGNSGGTICRDLDGDGLQELLTPEIVHWDVGSSADPTEILANAGGLRFERPGNEATGLDRAHPDSGWDDGDITASAADIDNDGRPDLYIGGTDYEGNRGLLYHALGALRFEAVPVELGVDHTRSHGSTFADFDRDGDLDLVVGHSSQRCAADCYPTFGVRIFENLSSELGNWVQLDLRQRDGSNRRAIGARVSATTDAGVQVQWVDGGHGQWGQQDDLVLHFGLGAADSAEIEVRWMDPDATVERWTVDAGARWRLAQGDAPAVVP